MFITCEKVRHGILLELERRKQASGRSGVESRSIDVGDVNAEYVSGTELSDVLRVSKFAREELVRLPPEDLLLDAAVFWLARKELLQLIDRYSQAIIFQVGAQRNLHAHNKGLCNAEIKNLFCEPGEDDDALFVWVGILIAFHRQIIHSESDETALNELVQLFSGIAEIYYDLTEAVYSTKLALKCRRAFFAFWRHLGSIDFVDFYNEYIQCRQSLDTAIMNGNAGKFVNLDLCTASLASSLIGINKSLAELKATTAAVADVKCRVGADVLGGSRKTSSRGPKGAHKQIPVKYAAMVYKVSEATISNWDQGKGAVPPQYPGRDVSEDEFNLAAANYHNAMGKKEGIMTRVTNAIDKRGK